MSTLTPGIYDPGEAPWWEFTCRAVLDDGSEQDSFEPVVKQWMGEAAKEFATTLCFRLMGEKIVYLQCEYLTLDGMTGTYLLEFSNHPDKSFALYVTRDPVPVTQPKGSDYDA